MQRLQSAARAAPLPARITYRSVERSGCIERVEEVSPYGLELIEDDAAHAPRGTRVDITLPARAAADDLATIAEKLGRLSRRGIEVRIVRDATWVAT